MLKPTLDEIKQLAKDGRYQTAPVCLEILSDIRTPIEVLRILKSVSSHCFLLESVADHEKWGQIHVSGL